MQETAGSISGVKDAIPGAITDVASAISAAMSQIKGETPAGAPTPAPASTPAPSGAWRGGLIGNSAFASGGLVGFDDGGSTDKPVPPTSAPPAPAVPSGGGGFLAKAANVAGRLFSGIGNAAVNAAKLPGDVRSGKFNVTPEKLGMWSETDQWRQDRSNKIAFGRSVDLAGGIAAGMRGFGAEGSTADLLGTTQKGTGAPLDPTGGSDKSSWQKLLGYWGGGLPGFAQGSVRGPGTGTSDSILARLSNGEFVMKAASVRAYGEGFMHALNNIQIPPPKYAMGGMVPASSVPRLAEGGAVSGSGYSTLNLTIGDKPFNGLKAPDHVAAQLKAYAISQQTTQTGKKPSWVGT